MINQALKYKNNPFNHNDNSLISCSYTNNTKYLKIIRIANTNDRCLEKVVLPNSTVYFQAQPESFLEIHGNESISSILEDKIVCSYLQVE